ncbi:MAG: hypothetical protein AAF206_05090 [Bacteroidota bacterium]
MKRLFLFTSLCLIIMCHCQAQIIEAFSISKCDQSSAEYHFSKERIIDSTYTNNTLNISILVEGDCLLGSKIGVSQRMDTLYLIAGIQPQIHAATEGTFCTCQFVLTYTINRLVQQNYSIVYLENEKWTGKVLHVEAYDFFKISMPAHGSEQENKDALSNNIQHELYLAYLSLAALEHLLSLKKEGVLSKKKEDALKEEHAFLLQQAMDLHFMSIKVVEPGMIEATYLERQEKRLSEQYKIIEQKFSTLTNELAEWGVDLN